MDQKTANQKIMDFLKKGKPAVPLSVNERSIEIFGNEKYLASPECKQILNQHKISIGLFNVYSTPEPFIYYNTHYNSKDALIVENKDTWYTMRKLLKEYNSICGFDFGAIIYGEGRKIQSSFEYMEADDTRDIHDINTFYYFGDIDSSGIDILYKLRERYPQYSIFPFEPGYAFLYKNRRRGRTKELQMPVPISIQEVRVLDFLGEDAVNDIFTICNHDYIIPQELLNYEVLSNWDLFDPVFDIA